MGRLIERAKLAAVVPHGGRVVPEVRRDDVRETFLRTYRIVYRIAGEDIRVLTVFEGHRNLRRGGLDPDG